MNTNYENAIGRLRSSFEDLCTLLERKEKRNEECSQRSGYSRQMAKADLVSTPCTFSILSHYGFPVEKLNERTSSGIQAAKNYFFTDWWKDDIDDREYMDRTNPERLVWNGVFRHGLFLATLRQDWQAVAKLASYFDDTLIEGILEADMTDSVDLLLLDAAGRIAGDVPYSQGVVRQLIADQGSKRGKAMLAAMDAVEAGDEAGLKKSLTEEVKLFLKHDAEDVPNVMYWVDAHGSIVAAMAQRAGLQLPSLTPKRAAAIVTHESVGLD